MRSIFSSEDVKNIISGVFKTNDEQIIEMKESATSGTQMSLINYLGIEFYNWKYRVENLYESDVFGTWVQSLNNSLDKIYALVETIDNDTTISQDIDSATLVGKITFLCPTNKIKNLDYFCSKLRNAYIGNPQDLQNSFGDVLKAYINLGILLYDEEPTMTQLGETIVCSVNFDINYLTKALDYTDQAISLSFDNTTYYPLTMIKGTWQNVFTSNAVPKQARPDLTGFVASSVSQVKTISFYDFDKDLQKAFNTMFWRIGAISIDGVATTTQEVNIPIWVKVVVDGHTYLYKDIIDNMQKVISNGTFNISSITLKGYGK